jgi:hypothetical protein
LRDADSGVLLGERFSFEGEGNGVFADTIGAFLVSAHADVRMATPHRSVQGVAKPEDLIGASVFKLDASSSLQRGKVTGVGGAIRFVDPYSGRHTILKDVVEVRFDGGGPDPVSSGEAGSLIIDERDRAVGLLMCGARDECYVAPLKPFLEAKNLRLADGRAPGTSGADGALTQYRSELRLATSGGNRMRAALLAEDTSHEDPEGNAVPQRLLDLLGAG